MELKNQIIADLTQANEQNFLETKKEIMDAISLNKEKIKTLKIKKAKLGLQSILANIINDPKNGLEVTENVGALIVNLFISAIYPYLSYSIFMFLIIVSSIFFDVSWLLYINNEILKFFNIVPKLDVLTFGQIMGVSFSIGLASSFLFEHSLPNLCTPIKLTQKKIEEKLELKLKELNENKIKNIKTIKDWDLLTSERHNPSNSMSELLNTGVSTEILKLLPELFSKEDLKNIIIVNKSGGHVSYGNLIYLINMKYEKDVINNVCDKIFMV